METDEWESLEKESHPKKPLFDHVKEVKKYLTKLLNFYNFPKDFFEIANYIAEYHDIGKLNKKWKINNKNNPSHSSLSVKYLINFRKIFQGREITYVLWYLILKHHSSLTTIVKDPEFYYLIKEVENIVSNGKLDFYYKINLIDTFGLFKISDVCSAVGKSFKLERPIIYEEDIRKIISKEIDAKRWSQQQRLAYLPNIAMLRAHTGWGKTDVSLLFFKKKKVKKIFYLFPTITAINQFYKKLRRAFNDDVIKYFYFFDTEVKDDQELLQDMFFVENFLKRFVITTVDQFLLSFLQVGKYYKKRVMFRDSGLIIDEVHLLNPLMLRLITYFLKRLGKIYKFKVLFMSATLPNSMKRYIESELNLPKNSFLDFSSEYKSKKRIKFEYYDHAMEMNVEDIIKEYEKGKKVLVVTNTVENSINLAGKFAREIGRDKILLLHARFMYRDRRNKEGKIDTLRDRPHLLITTQVCEVSLDISYDFLFTELAPLPSLIQRFGRVNRYGSRTEETNIKIFKPIKKSEKFYPYTEESLEAAKEVIKELEEDKLNSEMDLLTSLDKVYSYEKFMGELERETKRIDLEAFEKNLQFFFSLDLKEEELSHILNYRDSFTTLIVPAPANIEERRLKSDVEKLLKSLKDFENKNFLEKRQLFAKIKEISIPVPIWWLREVKDRTERGFPIIEFKDKVYNSWYGLMEMKGEIV